MIAEQPTTTQGVLELHPQGARLPPQPGPQLRPQPGDPYVPAPLIHKPALREGHARRPAPRAAAKGPGPRLTAVEHIEGRDPRQFARRNFDELTPIDPHEQIVLETGPRAADHARHGPAHADRQGAARA